MEGIVVERAPEAHCHRCASVEIAGVCVQCRQLMCPAHLPPPAPRWARWLGKLLYRLRIIDPPYDGSAVVCHDCQAHSLLPMLGLISLLALAYLGFGGWILARGAVWGAAVVLIGLLWLGVLWLAPRRLARRGAMDGRRTIQLAPRMDRRQIEDKVKGHIELDDQGRYHVTVDKTSLLGKATLVFSISRQDQERVSKFIRKQRKVARAKLRYRAGFVVFKGRVSNRLSSLVDSSVKLLPGPVVALEDKLTNAPNLFPSGSPKAQPWTIVYGYTLLQEMPRESFPVQLLPALRPDSGQKVLDLTVQWRNPFPNTAPIAAQYIESMKVLFPEGWGTIQYASPNHKPPRDPITLKNGRRVYQITWNRVPLTQRDQERQRHIFTIKFDKCIQLSDSIEGAVSVIFRNSLFGMTGIEFFGAAGKPLALDEGMDITTRVEAQYQLSMATLRHQETLVFPDSQPVPTGENSDAEEGDQVTIERSGDDASWAADLVTPKTYYIVPDAETVVHLTNALSEAGFHIQWVLENQPYVGTAANIIRRSWDIGGRHYKGINPIAFHLMISGEQTGQKTALTACQTKAILAVNGVYAADEMRGEIINTCQQLYHHIDKVLTALQKQSAGPANSPELGTGRPFAPTGVGDRSAGA